MSTPNLTQVIKRMKEVLGVKTDGELAKCLGRKQSALAMWKKRNKVPKDLLYYFCEKYNINLDWLLTGKGQMHQYQFQVWEPRAPYLTKQKDLSKIIPAKPVPVIDVQVPAGFPELALTKEQVVDYLYLPDIPTSALAIKVKGNSMEPTIEDGDYIVFLPVTVLPEPIKNGDIVIVKNEWNELILKRYRQKDNKVYLTSDNPKYPTIEPTEDYKIVGKVIRRVKEQRF